MITGKLEEMIEADLITWHEDEQVRSKHVEHMGASGDNVSDPRRLGPGHDNDGREGELSFLRSSLCHLDRRGPRKGHRYCASRRRTKRTGECKHYD